MVNVRKIQLFIILLLGAKSVQAFQLARLLNKMNESARNIVATVSQQAAENGKSDFGQYPGVDGDQKGWDSMPTRSQDLQQMNQDPNRQDPNKVYFSDIIGIEHVLAEVSEIVDYLRFSDVYRRLGARMPRGILLEGPPGNGKTMIAKAIANEASCSFFQASGSSFIEMYVGTGAARIRQLFAQARAHPPSIVFIDEFDAVAGVDRSALTGGGGDQEYKQTVNQLLTELDGFSSSSSTIVIAATNNAGSLDPAVKRSGRFDRIIHVPLPDCAGRKKLLEHYLIKLPRLDSDIEDEMLAKIAKDSEGLCAADFKNMVNEIAILAVRERSDAVCARHLTAGAAKVIAQRKKPDIKGDFRDIFKKGNSK